VNGARLWHARLRINRVLRVMLHWSATSTEMGAHALARGAAGGGDAINTE
jgi:hypothetical protein